MQLTERHKEVLRHTLGMKKDGDDAWRNHFVASEGHADMPVLNELLVAGYMAVRDNPGGSGYLFRATDKGRKALALAQQPHVSSCGCRLCDWRRNQGIVPMR